MDRGNTFQSLKIIGIAKKDIFITGRHDNLRVVAPLENKGIVT